MSAPTVYEMADRLIESEARTTGARRSLARRAVASRIGVSAGTLENLDRQRLKFVERVEAKVRGAFIGLLEYEIAKATHELNLARLLAHRGDTAAILAAEAALTAARELLGHPQG